MSDKADVNDDYFHATLVAHSPDVMFRLDRALRFLFVNPAVTGWTGLAPEVFLGKTGAEAGLTASLWHTLAAQCEIAFITDANTAREFNDETPHGTRRFAARFIPELDHSQHVATLLVIISDMTDRWRAQSDLSEKDVLLSLAETAGNLGRCEWQVPLGTLSLSPRMQAMFGVKTFDGRQESWLRLMHPDDSKRVQEAITGVFARHDTLFALQYRVVCPDGRIQWLESYYSVFYDDDGHPLRVVGENADITARKEAEQQLREINENLRQMSLNQARLIEAERNRIARNLHDGVGQLIYLMGMRLSAALPLATDPALLATLNDVCDVIGQATRDIRSIEFELSPPQLRQFGLLAALDWLKDDMARQFGLHVTITDDNLDKPLDTHMNASLYRAVRELLINVSKHAKVDSAKVDVRRAGARIEIQVSDSGVGFADGDRFNAGGGLGLRSVRETLVSGGGDFGIVHPQGRGTVATLSAPLSTSLAAAPPVAQAQTEQQGLA